LQAFFLSQPARGGDNARVREGELIRATFTEAVLPARGSSM
jgi:hypothetical protein